MVRGKQNGVQVRRLAERGVYDRATIDAILADSYLGHVAFIDDGRPVVIPMVVWRVGDYVHFHAANKGRVATVCADARVCISIAHLDGMVLARSAFNHSMNYRSLVIHGLCEVVHDAAERLAALEALTEHICAGRWPLLRPVRPNELAATVLLRVPLDQTAAKVRTGMPGDEADDPDWPVWTGVWPLHTSFGEPLADPTMPAGIEAGAPVKVS